MQIITHKQGTQAWLDARKDCDTASEAPVAAGESKYQKRQDLLHQKATGIDTEHNNATQSLFAKGHKAEANARPIAEEIIGEELFPITAMVEIEGLKLLASLDGLTMSDVAFEHKLYSESLADQVRSENLEPHYTIQMDQQCLITGAKKVLFMTSDGTKENMAWCWYTPTQVSLDNVICIWKQFHKDLANYVPQEVKAAPETKPAEALPVPSIQVRGEVTLSNLADVLPEFDRVLESTNTELVTDDHFAQADIDAKASRNAAKNLKLTAQAVIDQIAPVSEVVRTLENYAGKFDALGLKLEKAVKSQKDLIKSNAIMKAIGELAKHTEALESEIKPIRLNMPTTDFAGAISGVKTIATMQDRIDTTLAQAKMDADAKARDIRAKMNWCKENAEGKSHLFPDLQQIIGKDMDDFTLLIKSRIAEAEQKEQERIQAEAQRIAEEKAAADQFRDATKMVDEAAKKILSAKLPEVQDTGLRIKLGDINAVLGFTVSAEFLSSIGWNPVAKEKNAMLYRASDFPAICESLVNHIDAVSIHGFKKAA